MASGAAGGKRRKKNDGALPRTEVALLPQPLFLVLPFPFFLAGKRRKKRKSGKKAEYGREEKIETGRSIHAGSSYFQFLSPLQCFSSKIKRARVTRNRSFNAKIRFSSFIIRVQIGKLVARLGKKRVKNFNSANKFKERGGESEGLFEQCMD